MVVVRSVLLTACACGFLLGYLVHRSWASSKVKRKHDAVAIANGIWDAVGNTPLIRIASLSEETGCEILAKCEFMNPGGSIKDRVAKGIIQQAESTGAIRPNDSFTLVEATAGSTGISLATLGRSRGYNVELFIPDNVSKEKINALESLGATVKIVPIVPMSVPSHFMHSAYQRCLSDPKAFYANQFDNLANFRAHYDGTAKEVWDQTGGNIDAIVMGAGTGGTLAGMTKFLKEKNPRLLSFLVDPPGSGLYNLVTKGVMFDKRDTMIVEPIVPRSFYEGVGINRQTENFAQVKLDGAFRCSEIEGIEMAYYVLQRDGIYIGGSSALNLVGAVKLARKIGPGKSIVTILADSGHRYSTRMYDKEWLRANDLSPTPRENHGLDFIESEEKSLN